MTFNSWEFLIFYPVVQLLFLHILSGGAGISDFRNDSGLLRDVEGYRAKRKCFFAKALSCNYASGVPWRSVLL